MQRFSRSLNLRDSDLKKVVLNQLFPQHGDAQLDTQLHQAASIRTLADEHAHTATPTRLYRRDWRAASTRGTGPDRPGPAFLLVSDIISVWLHLFFCTFDVCVCHTVVCVHVFVRTSSIL